MNRLFQSIAETANPGSAELSAFTFDVEAFLRNAISNDKDFGFLWEPDPALRQLAQAGMQIDVPRAGGRLRDAIPQIRPERLDEHGLRGAPLHFKFRVLAAISRQWERVKGTVSVRGWFKQMVDAIDAVLDSLLEAAGAVGALLKEFKDALGALAPAA
jgi:hypothetical protein